MSLQGSAMFEKFSKKFEDNGNLGKRYQLVLLTGRVVNGVPTTVKGGNPDGVFDVQLPDGKSESIKWSRLLSAAQVG